VLGGVSLAVLIVVGSLAWVGIRAYLAKGELEAAIPLATQVRSQIGEADGPGALASGQALTVHANRAVALTSDPVWRLVEFVPGLGKNLRVMRGLTEATDDVAQRAILPLTEMAGTLSLDSFKPVGGRIDVQPMLDAQLDVSTAANAIDHARAKVEGLDSEGVIGPLADARTKLSSLLSEASESVDVVDGAAQLIPAMLGNEGPRNYLVLFQNNAELRSTGGIPGAMVLVHTEKGSLSMLQQASTLDFPKFETPVIDLPVETKALYGDNTAQYIQDVNFTPQFAVTGQIAQEMWKRQFGVVVDGVISVDPVALSYLLRATGPIVLPTGDEINSGNAVKLLMQDVYSRYEDPVEQNAFFASASVSVFEKITNGGLDTKAFIAALAESGEERRILLWSTHEEDQAVLSDTTLSGPLPQSDVKVQAFGLYFNDATAAKMDPYLKVDVASSQAVCRNDGLPNYVTQVTLTNTAPVDAAVALPAYVTGGGSSGAPAGNIRPNVALYGAPGTFNLGVLRDGQAADYHPASDSGYTLSKLQVELAPGESTVLEFQFLGGDAESKKMVVDHTPLIYSLETSTVEFACENALQ
jgi:hypothetical protein